MPALVAIVLALITKQVCVSLFFGILFGGLFCAGENPIEAIGVVYQAMRTTAGANCNHVNHVNTQLPYAGLVAIIAFVSYLIAGLTTSLGSVLCGLILWAVAISLFVGAILLIKLIEKKKATTSVDA